jgi:hypothetical protein
VAELQLVIIEGQGAGREFVLAGAVVAGRDPDSGIVIDDQEASRRHASFAAEGTSVTVEDLGSTNGTYVNEERITASRTIAEGDRIRIGTTVLELRPAGQATQTVPPPTFETPSAAQAPPPAGPPAGGAPPTSQPPVPQSPSAMATSSYPINFVADYPQGGIERWRPFLQGVFFPVVAIPHFIALFFVWIGAFFAWIAAFFAILFTGRYPRGLFDFLAGTMRWSFRLIGYTYLFTEAYPPFSLGEHPEYPIRVPIEYPAEGIARWRPLVHWLLAIPHAIVIYFLGIAAFFVYVYAWFVLVFTGSYPAGPFNFLVGYHRWQTRYYGYLIWATEEYPPFTLD